MISIVDLSANLKNIDIDKEVSKNINIDKELFKHCQRHNGPRVLTLYWNIWQKSIWRWHHFYWFQVWPPGGVTCISSNFGHQMALLALLVNVAKSWCFLHDQMAPHALITNLATRWPHLHWFQFWPQGGATFISYKFGHLHCHATLPMIALDIVSWNWVGILISQSHIS